MDNSHEKIGFFKRIKIAIFKLEEYGTFLGERVGKSLKYFFLLILLITVATVAASAYDFNKMINTALNYITNEMPDFEYAENTLKFENNVEAYDHNYDFKLYINTDDEVPNETLEFYKNDINSVSEGAILLKDKFIYYANDQIIDETYEDISKIYELDSLNKESLLEKINLVGTTNLMLIYSVSSFISMYVVNVITIFMDLLLIAVFGYVASRFCGIRFKMTPMITLSIYALTLSIILSGIYNVVYILTGFVIKYFNIMYLLIAYVYIIAAIFMIKYDLIKQSEELQKIIEVQKQVRKETEEKEETDSEEKKEDKKEEKEEEPPVEIPKEEEKEPDGSEI